MFENLSKTSSDSILPRWIEIWNITSAVICILDVAYTMLRPLTVRGGILENFYYLWNIYSDVDLRYGDPKDIVTMATGRLMIIEIIMCLYIIYLNKKKSRHTVLTCFTVNVLIFWKTLLYLTLYIRQPHGTQSYIASNSSFFKTFFVFWVADGIWCLIPGLVIIKLWNRLATKETINNNNNEYGMVETNENDQELLKEVKSDNIILNKEDNEENNNKNNSSIEASANV
ncbi:Emopamil-binding family-containing protein [Strongyloides ratti]|uniref:Emopamil-binding family-containing protein n=1 Tax=Strongyloides ratti TaxID=34506 RepID=A0A090KTE6_STRRB|nr:Emopamil-binding family-containing protein [Strongyloides ratti]CEF60765.1 Emopamil-binding family-containing protein [Strongyloides ratti]